ncbi:MAG: hypothetical protein WAO58_09055 [Fimbriimonadaceae bacterium]
MQVACDKHDKDLLFLAHGLVGSIKGFILRLHLRRCGECRSRLKEFQTASNSLRDAFEGPVPQTIPFVPMLRRQLVLIALAGLLLATAFGAYYFAAPDSASDLSAPIPATDCEPGELNAPL